MGVNSIRTTHNPASPQLLDAAASLGLLVQEEAFDTWYRGKKRMTMDVSLTKMQLTQKPRRVRSGLILTLEPWSNVIKIIHPSSCGHSVMKWMRLMVENVH